MKDVSGFSRWLRLAKYLLEPQDVVRIIQPTIADALFERQVAKSEASWRWRSRFHLAAALCGALGSTIARRVMKTRWFGFLSLLIAGLGGAVAMRQGPMPEVARNQLLFLFLAAILGIIIIVLPARLLRSLGTVTILVGMVGLVACPWFGVDYDGQRQWLRLGSLQIHMATLTLPAFVVFTHRAVSAGTRLRLVAGTLSVLGLLLLQPNLEAVLVYGLTAATALMDGRAKWLSWASAGVLVLAVGAAMYASLHDSAWSLLGLGALALAIGWVVFADVTQVSRRVSTQTHTVAMVSMTLLRSLHSDTLPVVGFGGSAVLAFFVLIALQMREARAVVAAIET